MIRLKLNGLAIIRCAHTGRQLDVLPFANRLLDEGLNWWLYTMFNDVSGATNRGRLWTIDLGDGSTAVTDADADLDNLVASFTGLELPLTTEAGLIYYFLSENQYNGNTLREYLLRTSTTTGGQPSEVAFTRVVLPQDIAKTEDITVLLMHRITMTSDSAGAGVITRLGRRFAFRRLHNYTLAEITRYQVAGAGDAFDGELDDALAGMGGNSYIDTLDSVGISNAVASPAGNVPTGQGNWTNTQTALLDAASGTDVLFYRGGLSQVKTSANAMDVDWTITFANVATETYLKIATGFKIKIASGYSLRIG